ncbi:MAG TPA: ABC transporter substrate-binding protein [Candidatus Baltobacteraceae bacterium]|nr:ABC transporter substrate-binding protein [Candidatus Baltobacteraceae bacterium]
MIRWRWFGFAVAALLCACSRTAISTDTMTVAQQWEPRSLNPALENGTSSTEWSLLVFSYLVKYDDRGQLIPDVATGIPTVANGGISRDGKTIVYHIRKGIRFADGTVLTAADCAWSVNAINNPRNNVQSRFAYDDVTHADAPNATTLVLHLKRPFPPVITVVEAPQGFPIFPEHALAKFPDFNQVAFDSAPFGSGPYLVTRWSRGDSVELTANPYYWKGAPKIAHMKIRFVANPQTAMNLLKTREVDGYFDEQNYANYPLLKAIPGYRVTSTEQNAVGSIIFNTQDPLTSDARVRRALAEAIDIPTAITKIYRGALESRHAGAGLFLWAYDPHAYPDLPYNPADAKRLLDEAGWHTGSDGVRHKNGRALSLLLIIQAATPSEESLADNIVQYERAVGVQVTLKQYNITQFVAPSSENGPVYGGKFQMALYSFENGDDPDTTDQFACSNVPPNGYNKSRFCDPRTDALLKEGLSTYDRPQRSAVYRALQARLYEEMPIALIYRRAQVNTFTDRLRGQTTSLSGAFWNVGAWSLSSDPAPSRAVSNAACSPRIFPGNGTFAQTASALHGPGLVLSGGGSDIDDTFRWMHRTLTGSSSARGGNVIVLRAYTDKDEYSPYIQPLGPFQSVRTIGIPHCATRAQVDALAKYVDQADAVFFAGGDQANYVPWKGSALIDAVQRLWNRGGVIGGTSAGLAVQGAVIYDSVAADRLHVSDPDYEVHTKVALRNPFTPEISLTTGFLSWPPLVDVITDTHFARRDRFGRSVAFMVRAKADKRTASGTIYGVAVDERSSLVVDKNGVATLLEYRGPGYRTRGAYLLRLLNVQRAVPGVPLVATVRVLHLDRPGETLNLFTKTGDGKSYTVTVNGAHATPYDRDPYQ